MLVLVFTCRKCHIVVNHMSWLNYVVVVVVLAHLSRRLRGGLLVYQ